MTDNEALVPEIHMNHSIEPEGSGYYVQLGDQRFTQAQWELVLLYAKGTQIVESLKTYSLLDYFDSTTAERARQIEKGYDAEHDDGTGLDHLLVMAQQYHMRGEQVPVAGLLQAAREYLTRNPERIGASMQQMVKAFHVAMGQPVGLAPHPLPDHRIAVRVELIREEFIDELIPALRSHDLTETVDACIDILYVVFGLLVEMGVLAYPLFAEVQRSNMSKLGANGRPIIAGPNDPDGIFEGRVKKGPGYFRPDLKAILLSGEADLG